ncbi:MAG: phage portal protein [Eubacteriales bacterium]|nr:phage portal protein [Eubacteriales bacterium]
MSIFTFGRKGARENEITTLKAEIAALKAAPAPNTRIRRLVTSWLPHFLRGDYTLQNSELIFSAVSRISNALSAMPVQLYRGSTQVKSDLNDLISVEPNPNMTSCQFFKTLEACKCTEGNAYAIKLFDPGGVLIGLRPLDPLRVRPVMETGSMELWYRIAPEQGADYYLHNFYVLHVPFMSTNGYSGVNPVSVLFNTLSYSTEIQKFSASQLQKGINAQVVLEAPANLGQQQKTDMINDFMDTYRETAGNILLLESGVQAKTLNLSPVDSKLFDVEKISRSRVAMVYNIPPHLMGDYSDTSFSSQEQQMLEFLMLTMLPIVTAYEQELNRKLLSREQRRTMRFKFDMDAILRADAATRADVHQKAIRGGWETPNEARAEYGRANDPNGSKLLVARDLTTLEYIVKNPAGNPEGGKSNVSKPNMPA